MLWGFFDPLYFIILAPGLALSLYATWRQNRHSQNTRKLGRAVD